MTVAPLRCPCCHERSCRREECEQALLDAITGGRGATPRANPDQPAWAQLRSEKCVPLVCDPPTQREVLAYLHQRRRVGKKELASLYGVDTRTIFSWLGRQR